MTQSNEPGIEVMNEVISLFMELHKGGEWHHHPVNIGIGGYRVYEMRYHASWDWLMPVVEKIEKLSELIVKKVWISINGNSCAVWTYFDVRDILRSAMPNDTFKIKQNSKSKLEATHAAVYQFITWYNQQKQTNGVQA